MKVELTWSQFKSIGLTKSRIRYLETDSFYTVEYVDELGEFTCCVLKDSGTPQSEFESSYKGYANSALLTPIARDSKPFALPEHRTKRDATDSPIDIAVNSSDNIDFLMEEERYVSGGTLLIENAEFGDYVSACVYDVDSVIPEVARASTCEDWPLVAEYVVKEFVEVEDGTVTRHKIDTQPLSAKIGAGLYLRVTYYAVNSGSARKAVVNYKLTKKL